MLAPTTKCPAVLISDKYHISKTILLSKALVDTVRFMTTRLQLRATIREILEDSSGSPLWSDAALNEYLATAMRIYGARFPRQATAATDPITPAATSVALPAGLLATEIVAIRDARGRVVPPASQRTGPAPSDATK